MVGGGDDDDKDNDDDEDDDDEDNDDENEDVLNIMILYSTQTFCSVFVWRCVEEGE